MTVHLHPERAAPRLTRPSHRAIDGAERIGELRGADLNVLTWPGAAPASALGRAERLLAADAIIDARTRLTGPDWRRAAEILVADVDDRELAAAVAALAADVALALAQLAGARQIVARLETLDREICPRLHADHVVARALCTFAGPGTEWVCNGDLRVDPLAVCGRDFDAVNRAIVDPSRVRRAPAGEVVVLKGAAWPGQRCGGAVHKAPPVDATSRRLVLKLDVPAPDAPAARDRPVGVLTTRPPAPSTSPEVR